ncbi:CpXC domain-containing protein [Pseudophaeobacter sp. EL27]|uniref:CpXC domain-containing protein n=1 Tax=Pseudophaeobacter sp. EL27 TaxID=2107580 RepID=UPI0020B11D08|nr:CpXC domain-containing protein [Pseudophaeobacter sp. EL27]
MSLFVPMNLTCPECAEVFTSEAVGSVNADRRADLRDEILAGRFQIMRCSACAHEFRLEPDFNYLDVGRSQWIAALPARALRDHLEIAAEKQAVFDLSYGSQAPAAAQSVGQGLQQRLVFGWPALREKLVLAENGLDDVIWEVAKLDLLRSLPEAPLGEGVELRLMGVSGDLLDLAWIRAESEEHLNDFQVERGLYDGILAAPAPWAAVQALLGASMFVDIQKLFMGTGEDAA